MWQKLSHRKMFAIRNIKWRWRRKVVGLWSWAIRRQRELLETPVVRERGRVRKDRRVMERFWEHTQRISWKCHIHSVQTIDFGVVFKATQLLACQISSSKLKQNGFTNLFSFCTAQSGEEAMWGERQDRRGRVVCNPQPPEPTLCSHAYKHWNKPRHS